MLLLHRFLEGMTVGAKSTVANSLQRVDSPINTPPAAPAPAPFAPTRHPLSLQHYSLQHYSFVGASCHPCCSLNCLLLTVGMKRAAAAALTGRAPKRQKLHRTNLTPGQPKMCHVCRRMLPSRNKLMLHLRHGHPACTTRTTRTSTDQASATEAPATNQASATEASAINQAPATEASATNQASATATDRNQPAAPVAAQSTQTRASPARTSQHLQWTAPAYRPVQRSSPHPSAIAFAVIASTTRTLAAVSAVSSVASLVARRGAITPATAAVAIFLF